MDERTVQAGLVMTTMAGVLGTMYWLGKQFGDAPAASALKDNEQVQYQRLTEVGYKILDNKIVDINTEKPFVWKGAKNFDTVSHLVTEEIQSILRTTLEEHFITSGGKKTNFFCSKDWKTKKQMVLLIQASGKERAGVWSRKLLLSHSIDHGSMLAYVDAIKAHGCSVIIANPNLDNKNSQSLEHLVEIYDKYICDSGVESLAILGFGSGGKACVNLLQERLSIMNILKAVAFVHSLHTIDPNTAPEVVDFLKKSSKNWVPSEKPLNHVVHDPMSFASGCRWVSGGHTESTQCLHTAMGEICKFFHRSFSEDF
eukprot:TRINITY_DN8524_c0_g1_i1.p1 TRINITY_DN8524_c0_g1~~TRINITY_DN8524_c0_g1_i1.p1  ORF type:complete len:313 (+),score=55.32 TRINITY_DN8524_c0_g1_i1:42-980(+)